MKKIFIILGIILTLTILNEKEYNMTNDMIRFRVIANSNSSEDILMKNKIVNEVSSTLFKNNKSIENTRENIITNISNIENKIEKLFKDNNYNKNFNIKYGYNYFPKKEYKDKKFKEGNYESIVIEVGSAKGDNYWCILYPPLCMADANAQKIEYKSKIVELFSNLFK